LQLSIAALFESNPHDTFSTEEIVRHVFPGLDLIEKKHRVAVIRAADSVCTRLGWSGGRAECPGHPTIYYNVLDVQSYAQFKHRAKGAKIREEDLMPGGVWWWHVEIYRLELEGKDTSDTMAALKACVREKYPGLV